jgi:caffeoyl-CoA O-methyltransferase
MEYDPEHAAMARRFIEKSGFGDRIQLMEGDARKLIPQVESTFDLVFIDADKESYGTYFDLVIDKCRSGSIIIADNVLWSGKVVDEPKDKKTEIIDRFNKKIHADARVETVILPVRDGLSLIRVL